MNIRKPCAKPCPACPYTVDSAEGYFAGNDADEYLVALSRDTVIACHTRSHYDDTGMVNIAVVCTGHIVAQIKSCKRPNHHPEAEAAHTQIQGQANLEALKEKSLSIFNFSKHHNLS